MATLDGALRRAVLRELREPASHRYQLFFEREGSRSSVVVSLRPELPWIGRPAVRWEGPRRPPGPFAAVCARTLTGGVLEAVEKLGADRGVVFRFAGGPALVAELVTHGANLVLLDAAGRNVATARHPRSAHARLAVGEAYRPRALPVGKLVPFSEEPERIDAFLREIVRGGEDLLEALRRHLFGIGTAGARLVIEESLRKGRSPGEVLSARIEALTRGVLDPVVVAGSDDPISEAEQGRLDPSSIEILPWEPDFGKPGRHVLRRVDAAGTAGLYHEALERAAWVGLRGEGLLSILRVEINRLAAAEQSVTEDVAALESPEKHRHWAEALLAGLTSAHRSGDVAIVADPYDALAREIPVPAPGSMSLVAAAEDHFRRYRRARRGIEAADRRLESIRSRSARLEGIAHRHGEVRGLEEANRLADEMRHAGIPVGLEPATRAGKAAAHGSRPRLEGVRLFTSGDGLPILVGRTGKDNDRLTFKLAAPDDFWLHAMDVPGAHVIVRNPRREPRPPRSTLEEAAAIAAWYSAARDSDRADVRWTRRRNVRRIRGAPKGTVTVKRFETIRVRPTPPERQDREEKEGN